MVVQPLERGRVFVILFGTAVSGSVLFESVLHVDLNGATWISQSHGVHPFEVGATARLYVDVARGFLFDSSNRLVGGLG